MRFPSIAAIAADLRHAKGWIEKGDDMDVRLQVYEDGQWACPTTT